LTTKFVSLLGLCRKAGKVILGFEELQKTASRVQIVFVAKDVSERTLRNIQKTGVRFFVTDMTKTELGTVLGCGEVATAAVADRNFAEALEKNIQGGNQHVTD